MLELKNVVKVYKTNSLEVRALNDISLCFAEHEFVSILGESGCGKTTLLNIIGGLDRYTEGDLIIDGKSTKQFSASDWDAYRNHKIGFIFQSYNLIAHLSVLENVEMSLTINGTNRTERRQKAIDALKKVGLEDQTNKKPNQLSGGQMQRVAIARALVNDPEIILADEPTGALDSKTSVQIMDLIKQISSEKLVIMVTHNSKIAKQFSTRIISLVDGQISNDKQNNAKIVENLPKKPKKLHKKAPKQAKTSMNFFTAVYLSLKNLLSKKGRTIMTSFAGSIGIIGIALILAISSGLTNYLGGTQNQALSGSTVAITTATIDYDNLTSSFNIQTEDDQQDYDQNAITPFQSDLDITKFIKYGHFNYLGGDFAEQIADYNSQNQSKFKSIQYNYYLPIRLVSYNNSTNKYVYSNNENKINILSGDSVGEFFANNISQDVVDEEYEVVTVSDDFGNFENISQKQFELTLVADKKNQLKTGIFQTLGFDITELVDSSFNFKPISFDSIFAKTYKLIQNDDYYVYDGQTNFSKIDVSDQSTLGDLYNNINFATFKITKIIRQKDESKNEILSNGLMYSTDFENWYKQICKQSKIAQKQAERHLQELADEKTNFTFCDNFVFTISGLATAVPPFSDTQSALEYLTEYLNAKITSQDVYNIALQQIGASDVPQSIKYFPFDFAGKESLNSFIKQYNANVQLGYQIMPTDSASSLTNILKNVIETISKVLVAFASISLLVSSIMIGIITYVSVIERTKEIGVLRSIGARKKDISRVFTAEAMIIGFISGVIGILVTYFLSVIINLVVGSLLGIQNLAILSPISAIILIAISILLTLLSGLVPSKIASNRDPVECLRSE